MNRKLAFIIVHIQVLSVNLLYTKMEGLERSDVALFRNKCVLITGGTGYIGQTITEEILKYEPRKVIIFSRDEFKQYMVARRFNYNPKLDFVIGDIRNYQRLTSIMRNVDIVIHAAALKRIDVLEHNVSEAIKTNILGTFNVARACLENQVEKVVMISTDKACSPLNCYGACKLIGEKIFLNFDYQISENLGKTVYLVVRYGNVLESTGSVIPFFIERIKLQQNIPLTDPKMTRFVITKNNATKLIFDALRYGLGGEIFVPKLCAMQITDLINLLNNKFNSNCKTYITGIRPGEKIHEILLNNSEINHTIEFQDLYIITSVFKKLQNNVTYPIPIYMREGKLLSERNMKEYNSLNSVVSREKVALLLKEAEIL